MPAFTFDKIIKIISTVLTILQFSISIFTGEKVAEDTEKEG